MKRRKLLKNLAYVPLAGGLLGSSSLLKSCTVSPKYTNPAIFERLGLKSFINCAGTITTMSGCIMQPAVLDAMWSVSQHYVLMEDLERKVGERLATLLKCEAAMVTAGACSAYTLATAACITGFDQDKIRLIPDYIPGQRPEVIVQRSHRFGYDHSIRNTGAKLIDVEGPEEMQRAINPNTVMMMWFNAAGRHSVDMEQFIAIGKQNGIPTLNCASADVPPVDHFFKYIQAGFDLVAFSGGKGIMGPQSAGVLLGRKDLINAALENKMTVRNSADTIGRGMKVNKEEIVGMLVAVEEYLKRDHDKEYQMWVSRIERMKESAEKVPTVKGELRRPNGPANFFPYLNLTWDKNVVKLTTQQVQRALEEGDPSIYVIRPAVNPPRPEPPETPPSLRVSVMVMLENEVDIVARRLKEVLEQGVS